MTPPAVTPYRTIVVDPPWRYRSTAITTGGARPAHVGRSSMMVEGQYPTLTNEEIAALPVGALSADSAHLYLWVTNPRLFGEYSGDGPTPIEIVRGWGFTYVTLLTWHKLGPPGMGFYFRGDTEHVIFAARRRCAIPAALRVSNHFAARKGRHSAKPDRFYEIVERVSPGPRLELFARRRRYDWDVWGDEAPVEQASQAPMDLEVPA